MASPTAVLGAAASPAELAPDAVESAPPGATPAPWEIAELETVSGTDS